MNYNTFIHAVAGVNEVLHKQAAMQKMAAGGGPGKLSKAWESIKGNPWKSALGAGAGGGMLAGGLYGGLSEDGSVPLGMLGGAAGGLALGAGGMGGLRAFQNRAQAANALKQYFAGNVANGAWYADPRLGAALGMGALGAGIGYGAGDGMGAGIGGLIGAGAGYGAARFAMPRVNRAMNAAAMANVAEGGRALK